MFPAFTGNYSPRSIGAYSINLSQRNCGASSRIIGFSHFPHFAISELGKSLFCSPALPSLVVPISHVVSVCANKEMRRSYAGMIIAVMKNILSIWNWAFIQSPGNTMRHLTRAISDSSVTVCCAAGPNPAFSRFVNLLPKSFLKRREYPGSHCIYVSTVEVK